MEGKSIFKKSGIYLIGNLSSKILSVLIIPFYAFYINASDLGYFDLTQTIMSIIVPFMFIAIWEANLRYLLYETNEEIKKSILSTSIIFASFVIIALILIFSLYSVFVSDDANHTVFLLCLMFISYGMTQMWQYLARAMQKNYLFVISGILGTLINFISLILLIIYYDYGLTGLFISYILGQLSIFLLLESQLRITKIICLKSFDILLLNKMIKFSFPLVLNLVAAWLLLGFGKLLVTMQFGTEINGLYSFASKFSILVTMIGSVVTMAIIEEAIISAKTKGIDNKTSKTFEFIFKLFILIGMLAVPTINIFYYFIQNTEFYSSIVYAPWLLLFALFQTMASNIGAMFQAIDKTKYQFTTTVIGALVTIILSISLITYLGVYAVILGQTLGAFTMLITRYVLINKYVAFVINWTVISTLFVALILLIILSVKLSIVLNLSILIVLLLLIIYFNRVFLLSNLKKIKKY